MVVLGWWLDLMTFEVFSKLWFSASLVLAGRWWVGCTLCPWSQVDSDGLVVPCFRTHLSRHGGVGLTVGLDDLRGLFQAVIFCIPGLGRVVMGRLYCVSLVAGGQWWVGCTMLQDTVEQARCRWVDGWTWWPSRSFPNSDFLHPWSWPGGDGSVVPCVPGRSWAVTGWLYHASGHSWAGTVVLGWRLDLMTFEVFSKLWFSASLISAGWWWVGCTTCLWSQLDSDGSLIACFRTRFRRHGGVGLMVGLDDLRGLFQAVILCVPGHGRVVMGWFYPASLVTGGQWWVGCTVLQVMV